MDPGTYEGWIFRWRPIPVLAKRNVGPAKCLEHWQSARLGFDGNSGQWPLSVGIECISRDHACGLYPGYLEGDFALNHQCGLSLGRRVISSPRERKRCKS